MSLYLSRVRIARNPAASAIRALIDPLAEPTRERLHDAAQGRMMDAHHRLIWALFGDSPDRTRDFLWRAEGNGTFLTLSERPPAEDGAGLFEPPQVKTFAPALQPGDRLAFMLRANATRTRKQQSDPKGRGVRVDVVMDAIHKISPGPDRQVAREQSTEAAGHQWLAQQGEKAGFMVQQTVVTDYSVIPLPSHRGPRENQPQFGVLSLTGMIEVSDPVRFVTQIAAGFGRAKAFGCGLMLIKRG